MADVPNGFRLEMSYYVQLGDTLKLGSSGIQRTVLDVAPAGGYGVLVTVDGPPLEVYESDRIPVMHSKGEHLGPPEGP